MGTPLEYPPYAMAKFTELHYVLATNPKLAELKLRQAFAQGGGMMKGAEKLGISERQFRRYCRDLNLDLIGEAEASKSALLHKVRLEKAEQLLALKEHGAAAQRLRELTTLPDLPSWVMLEAYVMLARAQLLSGNDQGARDAFLRLFIAQPDFELPRSTPAALRKLCAEALENIAVQARSKAKAVAGQSGRP